jgi:hypothetical protein
MGTPSLTVLLYDPTNTAGRNDRLREVVVRRLGASAVVSLSQGQKLGDKEGTYRLGLIHETDTHDYAGEDFEEEFAERVDEKGGLLVFHTFGLARERAVVRWSEHSPHLSVVRCGSDLVLMNVERFLDRWETDGQLEAELICTRPESTDTLAALAILSQGYLAAHATSDGTYEGEGDPPENWTQALGYMGWHRLRREADGETVLPPSLASPEGRRALRARVSQVEGYWDSLLDERDIVECLKTEWGHDGDGEDLERVLELVKALGKGRADMTPRLVAEALCAISRRCGVAGAP